MAMRNNFYFSFLLAFDDLIENPGGCFCHAAKMAVHPGS
jgi:hypothetical protein